MHLTPETWVSHDDVIGTFETAFSSSNSRQPMSNSIEGVEAIFVRFDARKHCFCQARRLRDNANFLYVPEALWRQWHAMLCGKSCEPSDNRRSLL